MSVMSVGESKDSADFTVTGRSPAALAWRRFRRNKVAMVGGIVSAIIILIAAAAPLLTMWFGLDPLKLDGGALNSFGTPIGKFGGVSWEHWLGVEPGTGRDILARLIYGARTSLFVALVATFLTTSFGVLMGLLAGYRRGWVDAVIGRSMDLMLAFPSLLLMIALFAPMTQRLESLGFPQGNPARLAYIILILSFFGWVYIARIIRGQVLSMREREFVDAAKASGAGTWYMVRRQLLPNLWAPIIVYATLTLPGYVAVEATLSYLGIGVLPPTPTWGAMLSDSVRYYRNDPFYLFIPGTALVILVLAFNLFGDGLRDALDPKSDRGEVK